MKNYELLYIISPNITPPEVKDVFDEVNKLVSDLKGEILKTPENHPFLRTNAQDRNEAEQQNLINLPVTKKRLAYPVDKNKNGYYALVNLSIEAEKVAEFDKKIKLVKNVLRHLIIRAEPMSQNQIKHLSKLTTRKKAEKEGKPVETPIHRVSSVAPRVSSVAPKTPTPEIKLKEKPKKIEEREIEEIKEEVKETEEIKKEEKAPEIKEVKEVKEIKETEKETAVKKKKPAGKKIKLDDLEKKLDKILDEAII